MTEQPTNPAPYVYPEPGGDETLTVTRDGDDVHIAASNEAVDGGGGVTYVPITDAAEVADAIRTAAGLPTVDAAMAAAVRSALEDFAAVVVGYCPDHGDRDPARVTCHCPIARELRATAAAAAPAREQASPVDWEAIARQRERELKAAGEARHRAEVERDAVRRHADPCDGNCGTTILECAVANDVEPPARVQDTARQPDEERRARYAAAIQRRVVQGYTLTSILPEVYEAADAAMAVAAAEQTAAVRRALDDAAKHQREFVLSDDYACDDWEAALTVVDLIDPAVTSPAREQGEAQQPETATRAKAFRDAADFMRDAHFRDGMSVQEIGTALRLDADAIAQQPAPDA